MGRGRAAAPARGRARGERGADGVVVLQQQRGAALVTGVALGLGFPHRHGPALLPRDDALIIPIRALHEPHGDALALGAGPVDELAQIGLAVLEVRLHRDAALRAVSELRLGEDRFEEAQREVLHRVTLHVHADAGAEFLRAAQHGAQTLAEFRDGGFGIGHVNLRVKGGELHGEIDRDVELVPHGCKQRCGAAPSPLPEGGERETEAPLGFHFAVSRASKSMSAR